MGSCFFGQGLDKGEIENFRLNGMGKQAKTRKYGTMLHNTGKHDAFGGCE